jgi:Alpha-kinase family
MGGSLASMTKVLAMEAFSHYTYHKSGGQLIVCDLQGRYRDNRYTPSKSRFELTDPAVCSRRRSDGPTDLGEKGIESFFANHSCNRYCHADGNRWSSPRYHRDWFVSSSATSMMRSTVTNLLQTSNPVRFNAQLEPFYEEDESDSDDY